MKTLIAAIALAFVASASAESTPQIDAALSQVKWGLGLSLGLPLIASIRDWLINHLDYEEKKKWGYMDTEGRESRWNEERKCWEEREYP